ncbi:hypothetical protein [Methylomonas sp. AM2-LC]|uniref:hypothetical protein n=1 Tax=Methylomonas sp. AM2-LC TaxID=3153301 RepID=UPI003267FBA4
MPKILISGTDSSILNVSYQASPVIGLEYLAVRRWPIKRVAIFAKACLGASQPQQAAKTTRPFNASGGPDSPSSPALAPKRLKS